MARNPVSSSSESHWNDRKSWPAVAQRKIQHVQTREQQPLPHAAQDSREQRDRNRHSREANCFQKPVPVRQPKNRGHGPITAHSERFGNGGQISAQGQNAARSDQSGDLNGKGRKRNQIDGGQQPQENPFRLGELPWRTRFPKVSRVK